MIGEDLVKLFWIHTHKKASLVLSGPVLVLSFIFI